MKLLIAAAALLLASTPALADAPKPEAKAPEAPKDHAVKITDQDLAALQFAIAHVGDRCGPQTEDFCRGQLMLDDFARRVGEQLAAEEDTRAKPADKPAK